MPETDGSTGLGCRLEGVGHPLASAVGAVLAPRRIVLVPTPGDGRPARAGRHTARAGPGTGWDLHEYRHSGLTHLGEGARPS